MSNTLTEQEIRDSIVPKSDQLNYDDLISGPIVVEVLSVGRGSREQPWIIEIAGHRPYKPCKGMRRVLVSAWGTDVSKWAGRHMELFGEPTVKYAGVEVGGIQIAKLSDIPQRVTVNLTVSRGKRVPFVVDVLHSATVDNVDTIATFRQWLADNGQTEQAAVDEIGTSLANATESDWDALRKWAKVNGNR